MDKMLGPRRSSRPSIVLGRVGCAVGRLRRVLGRRRSQSVQPLLALGRRRHRSCGVLRRRRVFGEVGRRLYAGRAPRPCSGPQRHQGRPRRRQDARVALRRGGRRHNFGRNARTGVVLLEDGGNTEVVDDAGFDLLPRPHGQHHHRRAHGRLVLYLARRRRCCQRRLRWQCDVLGILRHGICCRCRLIGLRRLWRGQGLWGFLGGRRRHRSERGGAQRVARGQLADQRSLPCTRTLPRRWRRGPGGVARRNLHHLRPALRRLDHARLRSAALAILVNVLHLRLRLLLREDASREFQRREWSRGQRGRGARSGLLPPVLRPCPRPGAVPLPLLGRALGSHL
mmetsp:Transcript_1173/g.3106  ORF Transcript_1173/g.3106 Transcript_1173/m.3106 type:complete len:340 (-) Transcript_1173:393-1412(-)